MTAIRCIVDYQENLSNKAYLITMDWKAVDERLMRRGELILDTENHEKNSKRGQADPAPVSG